MDILQILLFTVISLLTGMLVFVGVQAILILNHFQKTVRKLNAILDNASAFSSSFAKKENTGLIGNLKNINKIAQVLREQEKNSLPNQNVPYDEKKVVIDMVAETEEPPRYQHIFAMQERGRRFFYKNGKKLAS